jgi:hypothetical protein
MAQASCGGVVDLLSRSVGTERRRSAQDGRLWKKDDTMEVQ